MLLHSVAQACVRLDWRELPQLRWGLLTNMKQNSVWFGLGQICPTVELAEDSTAVSADLGLFITNVKQNSVWFGLGARCPNPFTQPPKVEIKKFQCPTARELPEDFKTHPTFIPSANFVGVMAVLNIGAFFLGHPEMK